MPCFNASLFIAESIQSVLNQSHTNFELIIVNDGSVDDSEKVIKTFDDERIRYFSQQNKGQCAASNFGISKATGDYIKFFDSDDVMNKNHLEKQVEKLNGKEDAICFCAWGRFSGDVRKTKIVDEIYNTDALPTDWLKLSLSCKYDMMPGWFWLIPRQLLIKSGGWNEKLSLNNDFEFSIRLLLNASYVFFAPDAIMYYRTGQNSLSGINSESALRSAYLSVKLGCGYLFQKEDSSSIRLLCANKYSFWLFNTYPDFPILCKELENEIIKLGGSNRKLDESPLMHFLQKCIGWKLAKRLKLFIYKSGHKTSQSRKTTFVF
jgi:glycosyltransferase involved in cell wall biosynthesis